MDVRGKQVSVRHATEWVEIGGLEHLNLGVATEHAARERAGYEQAMSACFTDYEIIGGERRWRRSLAR